ncbi:uncharacterized protein PRCAT00004534001 [Priceomyces carsonii]|uniref:uncharacterized protein n=1 Tax=Priceomyces carsonii TaxID=28549 RepID=UPI002ED88357|nr:unnamed protein product [Priceomyces carsonii]
MRARDLSGMQDNPLLKRKYKDLEFKYLYFKLQQLINTKVSLSLKYEQLKTPEIHSTLIKPITLRIVDMADSCLLQKKVGNGSDSHFMVEQTPRFEPQLEPCDLKLSINLIFILLLLRYEYLIQSENNLIRYELLITKANVCELLSIRMLREYKSTSRIALLFVEPMSTHDKSFNTLELSVLTKSKKFLSQPIIIQTLDKFYNGELLMKKSRGSYFDSEESTLLDTNVVNYHFNRVSINKVYTRSTIVPKYQSLVINMKLIFFILLYCVMILNYKHEFNDGVTMKFVEVLFWLFGLTFNFEFLVRVLNIEMKYLKKIIWHYVDFVLIILIDASFILKSTALYYDVFSIISIVLLPRILSIFNNYEFFNMIILSVRKMLWKLFGLFCLFLSLISGFYLSFISLTLRLTSYEVAFSMLKVFFGFTPAVWDNWDNYGNLGRLVQMGYLFLIQFIIGTILAIVLSEVFSKINISNKEEFNYTKTINLIIYFKVSKLNYEHSFYGTPILNKVSNVFKFPIILIIYFYEKIVSQVYSRKINNVQDLKFFTFLSKDDDYYNDNDMINIDDDSDASVILKSRKNSLFQRISSISENPKSNRNNNDLAPIQSISTLGNIKSASTDSLFIDELLSKKYGNNLQQKSKADHHTAGFESRRLNSRYLKKSISSLNINKPNKKVAITNWQFTKRLGHLEELMEQLLVAQTTLEALRRPSVNSEYQSGSVVGNGDIYNIAEASLDDINLINSDDDSIPHSQDDTLNLDYGSDSF